MSAASRQRYVEASLVKRDSLLLTLVCVAVAYSNCLYYIYIYIYMEVYNFAS